MARTLQELTASLKQAMANKEFEIKTVDGYRYYTDTLTNTIVIPITTTEETLRTYEKIVLDGIPSLPGGAVPDPFADLPRVSMFIGQPDTGKTYMAQKIANDCGITPLFKMCRDNLNLETLLEDFKLVDGKPVFEESLAIQYMSGTDRAIIILDEFNTLLTGVMKTLQPIFDDTSTTFEYRGKIYNKNMNCKFIVTLNDKDKGISIVPDAILSRCKLKFFEPVNVNTISQWTGTPVKWVTDLFNIYKICGLLSVFGTRQIKMLRGIKDTTQIINHLYGLCTMKNIDPKVLDTLQVKQMINAL